VIVEGVIWTDISAGSLDGDLKLVARSMEEYRMMGWVILLVGQLVFWPVLLVNRWPFVWPMINGPTN
jgi:hypothetical protein